MATTPRQARARLTTRAVVALVALLASALLLSAWPAFAQEEGLAESLTIHDVDTSDHPEVRLSVEPPATLFGTDLGAEVFTVAEDGTDRPIDLADQLTTDLEVVLTIDTSTSMGEDGRMAALAEAAVDFVAQMPPGTDVGVVEFNTAPAVVVEPTEDHVAVTEAINGLEPTGFTALYDAVPVSLDLLDADSDAEQAIVLFADGEDNNSESSRDDAVDAVADSGVPMHVIELFTDRHEPEALQALADATDGELAATDDTAELAGLYDAVASALVHRYDLVYTSEAFGDVEVTVSVDTDEVEAQETVTAGLPAPPPEPESEQEEEAVGPAIASGLDALATRVVDVPLLGQDPWLWVGAGLIGLALAFIVALLLLPSRQVRLAARQGGGNEAAAVRLQDGGGNGLSGFAERATQVAERVIRKRKVRRTIALELERAGIDMRPGEAVIVGIAGVLAGVAIGLLLGSALLALLLAVAALLVPRLVLRVLAERRREAFAEQLPDVLQLLSGSLRAGHGLSQAIDTVARDAEKPASEEFRRVVVESRLGRDFGDALDATAERMGNDDFAWIVQAIKINREVGGDLAEILDTVGDTIRERARLRRQVKALSAEGKLSAFVLYALPFAVVGFVLIANPDYLMTLVVEPAGWVMIAIAAVLMAVGGVWLRKIIQLQY